MDTCQISHIGIIGAGNQGAQIALRCILGNYQTHLYDISDKQIQEAVSRIRIWLQETHDFSEAEIDNLLRQRLQIFGNMDECVRETGLIIEAVPEILDLKQMIWKNLDVLAPAETMLASNSSSLPSSRIGKNVMRKEKTFNLNFGHPASQNHVEVMWNAYTSQDTKDAALAFLTSMGFVPLVTKKEIMGFSINRTWRAIKKEVLFLVDQGYADFEDIDRGFILELGVHKGPFQLMDEIGLDVVRDIELAYYAESGDESDLPPRILNERVVRGHLGVKTGEGFYRYPNPAYEQPGWLKKQDSSD
ncbi:MAG: 3-hydroxyacyl-CoA dehydrogenase family protein [Anaerolineales bacterium]|nr:3-hydroxyacyl-CoA dehydrogenase family protein [Anaerolineales bacterium]